MKVWGTRFEHVQRERVLTVSVTFMKTKTYTGLRTKYVGLCYLLSSWTPRFTQNWELNMLNCKSGSHYDFLLLEHSLGWIYITLIILLHSQSLTDQTDKPLSAWTQTAQCWEEAETLPEGCNGSQPPPGLAPASVACLPPWLKGKVQKADSVMG